MDSGLAGVSQVVILVMMMEETHKGDCGGSYGIPLEAGTHLWSGELWFCSLSCLPLC